MSAIPSHSGPKPSAASAGARHATVATPADVGRGVDRHGAVEALGLQAGVAVGLDVVGPELDGDAIGDLAGGEPELAAELEREQRRVVRLRHAELDGLAAVAAAGRVGGGVGQREPGDLRRRRELLPALGHLERDRAGLDRLLGHDARRRRGLLLLAAAPAAEQQPEDDRDDEHAGDRDREGEVAPLARLARLGLLVERARSVRGRAGPAGALGVRRRVASARGIAVAAPASSSSSERGGASGADATGSGSGAGGAGSSVGGRSGGGAT